MKLFGGAIEADVPDSFLDASEVREVPDNQEIYVGTWDNIDVSIIIELMEPLNKPSLIESLSFHIDEAHRVSDTNPEDLVKDMEIVNAKIGHHDVVYRIDMLKSPKETTLLMFALFHLKKFDTDVLITSTGTLPSSKAGSTPVIDGMVALVTTVIKTFDVRDPHLFQPSN